MRKLNGALNRVPINLYDRVWKILERVKGGIIIAGHLLPQVLRFFIIYEFYKKVFKNFLEDLSEF